MLPLCEWLADTPWSIALHESILAYPMIESIHVLTLCLFLGLALMLDLRLLGAAMRGTPVSEVAGQLLPWTIAGFVVMVITGLLLFYAIPVKTWLNVFFRIKLVLLVLAGVNAAVFHRTIWLQRGAWDQLPLPPFRARLAGGLSLLFWTGIVVAGRMIAYNWFDKV